MNSNSTDKIKSLLPDRTLALASAVGAALLRVVAYVPNFTPAGALCVYSGARLRGVQSFVIPLTLMIVTNYVLHILKGFPFLNTAIAFVLVSYAINILLGRFLRETENPLAVGGVALAGSLQFFVVTNFGSWLGSPAYSQDMAGLVQCYIAGIPFYSFTLLGDLGFTAILFGAHRILARRFFPNEAVAPQAA